MNHERWAAWCRGRWALLSAGLALVVYVMAYAQVTSWQCEYMRLENGVSVPINIALSDGTLEEKMAAYRFERFLDLVSPFLLGPTLALLTAVVWARAVQSPRLPFALAMLPVFGAVLLQYSVALLLAQEGASAPEPTPVQLLAWEVEALARMVLHSSCYLAVTGFAAMLVRSALLHVRARRVRA